MASLEQIVKFENEKRYVRDFINLPKKLYDSSENMENPNAMVEKFSAYIKENEKSMRAASKKFESKVSSMKSHEAEAYRESVQRKITPALNKLISLLVDFENRYPDEAMRLDSILKVDAKYTYQQ